MNRDSREYAGEERYYKDNITPPRSRKLFFSLSIALVVVVIIATVLGVIAFRLATSQAHSSGLLAATPTSALAVQSTLPASDTPTIQPTPTPTETTPAATETPSSASGTYLFNRELSCSGCVDPILVTIKQAAISTTVQNMTWTLILLNRTGEQVNFDFSGFNIVDASGTSYRGTGDWIETDLGYITQPGKPVSGTVVFPFMPNKGETYTLSVQMQFPLSGYSDIQFDPTPFTF